MPRREQPLESGDNALLRFAAGLRELRKQAGGPTYRQLSVRAHFSAASLSEAASGRKLPSLAVTLAYASACGADPEPWEARWRAVAEETRDHTENDADDDPPYAGLATFQPADAERFFGRETLVAELTERITEHRFLAVFGASGSGKSSLIRAGLTARFPSHEIAIITPGSHPIEECAIALSCVFKESAAVLRTELAADPRNLHLRIRQADIDLLLIVDQFEELFTLCQDEGERHWLIEALTTAASSRARVVLGIRADFYGHCGQHPPLLDAIRDAQLLVGPMSTDELRRAITEPAAQTGCRVETALVARLVADAAGQPAALPMVSHALLETWRRRRGTTLTLAGYEAIGGIQHALSRTAEDSYAELDAPQQDVAKRIFLRLIALGDGTEDTKRRIARHELGDDPTTTLVLDRLAAARLVTLDRDTVELTHEAIIRHWPRLRAWLTEDRDGQRIHHDLADATNGWESLGRDPGALYRGARLARARDWASARDSALTAREREFLDNSLSTEARDRLLARRRTRRSKQLVALLAALLLVASAATGYAIRSNQTATQQRNAALALSALREAGLIRLTNPALAMQLTLTGYRLDPTLSARDAMHEMFATPYAARLTGYGNAVSAIATSPDGKLVATATEDGATPVRLWEISDLHRPRELPKPPAKASSVAFSPTGAVLATLSGDGSPRLWDLTDPDHPRELTSSVVEGTTIPNTSVAFSPDGQFLVTASSSRNVRLWSVADPHRPQALLDLGDTTAIGVTGTQVAFSRIGRLLAVTGHDHALRLWDLSNPSAPRPVTMRSTIEGVFALAFSPDGPVLATAGVGSANQLWDIADPENPKPLGPMTGHTAAVFAVAFSADGRLVATGSEDRTTRVWDVSSPSAPIELTVLTGHADAVRAVSFTADGRTLATASTDRTARLEDISAISLGNHPSYVYAVAFSPNGRMMATGSGEHTVRLWNTVEPDHPRPLSTIEPADNVASMIFSPDGRFLVTTGVAGRAQLWDMANPRAPQPPTAIAGPAISTISIRADGRMVALTKEPTQLWNRSVTGDRSGQVALGTDVYLAAFGPGSRVLATADQALVTRLWDIADPDHPRTTAILGTRGYPLAFSGDGRLLALAHQDGTTRLWEVSDPDRPQEIGTIATGARLNPIPAAGAKAAFRADGRRLVTATGDRTARLWDISDPRHPREEATLRGHTADLLAVAFGPDGHTIATADNDHVVRLWETDVDRLAARVCEIAYPRITNAEWERYFPGLAYRPPCG